MSSHVTVAAINGSQDTLELLRVVLEQAGFVVVTALTHQIRDGSTNFEAFLLQHQPNVIIYDIALPYESQWRFFEHVRAIPACRNRPVIVTTTNVKQVRQIAAVDEHVYEIVGKPYDLDVLVRAVHQVVQSPGVEPNT